MARCRRFSDHSILSDLAVRQDAESKTDPFLLNSVFSKPLHMDQALAADVCIAYAQVW